MRAIPVNCGRALDVGCGEGLLSRKLAERCARVIGIDPVRSAAALGSGTRIDFVEGDAMTYPFEGASFDLITVVATLHHLPLTAALTRFRDLLRPGGVLAVVGLYRIQGLEDYAWSAAGVPVSWLLRRLRPFTEVAAPLAEPKETLREIRAACDAVLPGGVFRRRLLFRYSFVWRNLQA